MVAIRDTVRQPAGHEQHLERIGGVLDWKSWFAPLKLDVHGHTRTHRMRQAGVDALHCFRFVRRENCGRPGGWPWPEPAGPGDPLGHPGDVMLLGMMHWSGTALAENLLFCPHSSFECLDNAAPGARPLLTPDRSTAKEFEKTAQAVEKEPWRLHRVAAYLRQLIVEPPAPAPPSTAWLWNWVGQPAGGLAWPTAVSPADFGGVGEDKTPAELMIEDGLAPRGKRMRTTERGPPDVVAAPAVPPPIPAAGDVDAPASVDAPAAEPPRPEGRRPAAPLCPGLGCGKCRRSRMGCRVCKARFGWFEVALGHWEHRPE